MLHWWRDFSSFAASDLYHYHHREPGSVFVFLQQALLRDTSPRANQVRRRMFVSSPPFDLVTAMKNFQLSCDFKGCGKFVGGGCPSATPTNFQPNDDFEGCRKFVRGLPKRPPTNFQPNCDFKGWESSWGDCPSATPTNFRRKYDFEGCRKFVGGAARAPPPRTFSQTVISRVAESSWGAARAPPPRTFGQTMISRIAESSWGGGAARAPPPRTFSQGVISKVAESSWGGCPSATPTNSRPCMCYTYSVCMYHSVCMYDSVCMSACTNGFRRRPKTNTQRYYINTIYIHTCIHTLHYIT